MIQIMDMIQQTNHMKSEELNLLNSLISEEHKERAEWSWLTSVEVD